MYDRDCAIFAKALEKNTTLQSLSLPGECVAASCLSFGFCVALSIALVCVVVKCYCIGGVDNVHVFASRLNLSGH